MSSTASVRQGFPWAASILAVLAFGIAGYAIAFYLTGNPLSAGFIQGKEHFGGFHATPLWTLALVVHAACGSLALLTGGAQWLVTRSPLRRNPRVFRAVHVVTGLIYVAAVLGGGVSGGLLAVSAMGGIVSSLGFGFLDLAWMASTVAAFSWGNRARTNRDPARKAELQGRHRAWMVRSFALTSAAITLRIWMPLFGALDVDFLAGYVVISWLCWVPNLAVAELMVRKGRAARAALPG